MWPPLLLLLTAASAAAASPATHYPATPPPTPPSNNPQADDAAAAQRPRPHLLFVVVDDLGSNDLGFQGHQLHTPHIDSIAAESVLLKNYYVLPVRCASSSRR